MIEADILLAVVHVRDGTEIRYLSHVDLGFLYKAPAPPYTALVLSLSMKVILLGGKDR